MHVFCSQALTGEKFAALCKLEICSNSKSSETVCSTKITSINCYLKHNSFTVSSKHNDHTARSQPSISLALLTPVKIAHMLLASTQSKPLTSVISKWQVNADAQHAGTGLHHLIVAQLPWHCHLTDQHAAAAVCHTNEHL